MPAFRILAKGLAALFLVSVAAPADAQKLTSSPWSRFGIGEWQPQAFSQSFGMAGVGMALNNPAYINIQNPASYGWFDMTIFDTGIRGTSVLQQSDSLSQWRNNTTFSHFAFGFPLTRWWGISVGLSPYAGTGYKIVQTSSLSGIGTVTFNYEGSGGVNRAWIGNGIRIKNRFSIGVNASYLFGTTSYDRKAILTAPYAFSSRVREEISVNDFVFDAGLQYKARLSENWNMAIGATYDLGGNVNAEQFLLAYTYKPESEFEIIKDTLRFNPGTKGKITLPQSIGGGISFTSDRWTFATDVRTNSWSDLRTFGANDSLQNNMQIAGGVEFIPDKFAVNSFFRSLRYRTGLRYTTSRFPEAVEGMEELGISFGFGIPLRKSLSSINTGVEYSQRGNLSPGMIREKFIRFNFTVSINDRWFIKRKYN